MPYSVTDWSAKAGALGLGCQGVGAHETVRSTKVKICLDGNGRGLNLEMAWSVWESHGEAIS
jgi:hypothetical protein